MAAAMACRTLQVGSFLSCVLRTVGHSYLVAGESGLVG